MSVFERRPESSGANALVGRGMMAARLSRSFPDLRLTVFAKGRSGSIAVTHSGRDADPLQWFHQTQDYPSAEQRRLKGTSRMVTTPEPEALGRPMKDTPNLQHAPVLQDLRGAICTGEDAHHVHRLADHYAQWADTNQTCFPTAMTSEGMNP